MEKKKEKYREYLVLAGILCLLAAAGLLLAARKVPGFAEWYAETIYPVLVGSLGRFWGIFPFSVIELVICFLILAVIFALVRFWRRPGTFLALLFLGVSALLFSYASCCGVNYYRRPFSYYFRAGLGESAGEKPGDEELKELCMWLTEQVNASAVRLSETGGNYENMQKKGIDAMERLAECYPMLAGYYPQPKPLLFSWVLSVQQYAGIYMPFTIEANYNRDMVPYNIPHTICHEMSHLRGFMREDEANFIGYLACLESTDADYQYSGCLLGWIYAGNALAKVDFEEYVRLYGMLAEEVQEDLRENSAFWDQYEGKAAEAASQVNDAYLKANGQADGIKTYGQVVDLMLLDFVENRR